MRQLDWQVEYGAVPGAVAANHNILPADTRRGDEDYTLMGDLYGIQYAHMRRTFSYAPGILPLWIQSLVALPPDFITTDMEARKFFYRGGDGENVGIRHFFDGEWFVKMIVVGDEGRGAVVD